MATLDDVRRLNYAHHAKMTREHNANKETGKNEAVGEKDDASFASLLEKVPHVACALELGCASGGQWRILEKWADKIRGVDLYEPTVKQSQERGLDIQLGFVEKLPFADDEFDLVCSRHVMEHVSDIQTALKEIKRVLKPGGYVAAVTPHYFPDPEPAHLQKLRIDEWVNMYVETGFTVSESHLRQFNCMEAHIVARKSEEI
jgi:ubiquinone/menaquinone biosynthesis C-methylase UbiE